MNDDKLEYLEGLRGCASFIVFIGHIKNTFAPVFSEDLLAYLKALTGLSFLSHIVQSFVNVFFDGALAVYLFWFMSAYVISIKLFKPNNNNYLLFSFIKRYFRLAVPVLGAVLLAYLLMRFHLMYNLEPEFKNGWLGTFYTFEPNFLGAIQSALWNTFFAFNYSKNYNVTLWSMNPELYGSFFVFFVFGIFGTHKYRYVFYLLMIAGAFQLKNYSLVSFLLGFSLCDIDYSNENYLSKTLNKLLSNQLINLTLFGFVLLLAGQPNFFGFFDIIVSVAIVVLVLKTKSLQNFFRSKILVWLGKISFGLYVIHIPIICSFSCFLYLTLPFDHLTRSILVSAATVLLCLLIAYLFTKYIDDVGVKYSNKLTKKIVGA